MEPVAAIVTDLDGTILDEHKRLSIAALRAVKRLKTKGIPLVVATARTPSWVMGFHELVSGITLAVCCGGAVVWSPKSREVIWRETLSASVAGGIVASARAFHPEAGVALYDGARWWLTEDFAGRGPKRAGPTAIVPVDHLPLGTACSLSVHFPVAIVGGLKLDLAFRDLAHSPLVNESSNTVDFGPPGIDKSVGVRRALDSLGVNPAHAIAFGDDLPDLAMFALCGRSVAVANAHPDVLEAATHRGECVHEDGFVRALVALGVLELGLELHPLVRPDLPRCSCSEPKPRAPLQERS